jgi:predicted glycogen debranching enzyme
MERVDIEALGFDGLIRREWLSANGLGGYASSTVCGMNTRKYHGLLVAAMSPPVRRMVILSRIDERVVCNNQTIELASNEYPGTIAPQGYQHLRAFSPEPFPRWAYQSDGFTLEKSVRLLHGQNTVVVTYTLLAGEKPVELQLRPLLALRPIHELMLQWNGRLKAEARDRGSVRIAPTSRTPEVFIAHDGEFEERDVWYLNTIYRREQERGYAGLEDVWMPGVVHRQLRPGQTLHLACSMEKIDLDWVLMQQQPEIRTPRLVAANHDRQLEDLERSAEVYVVSSESRETTSIITHYPWSSPSVRGAMISMAGLLLVPGHYDAARSLLESTAALIDGGLLPSELPEDGGKPVYQGADVSLWFVQAVHQYFTYTGDEATIRRLVDVLDQIIDCYRRGTHLGIAADIDGLISTGDEFPTTWMDARLIDWVVTPRRGRPVEINALWYNAVRIVADFNRILGRPDRVSELSELADSVKLAFNRRFWNHDLNCLYDVVADQNADSAIRPNQIFAMSLPHQVLWPQRHAAVLETVLNELLTPLGVRSLSPRDSAYQGRYGGDVISRDRAYHQGSAYPWLLGPLVSALVKTRGRDEATINQAREILRGSLKYIQGEGMGLISELFDGDAPHARGGAPASSPAAGELLRSWAEDVLAIASPRRPVADDLPAAVATAK